MMAQKMEKLKQQIQLEEAEEEKQDVGYKEK